MFQSSVKAITFKGAIGAIPSSYSLGLILACNSVAGLVPFEMVAKEME